MLHQLSRTPLIGVVIRKCCAASLARSGKKDDEWEDEGLLASAARRSPPPTSSSSSSSSRSWLDRFLLLLFCFVILLLYTLFPTLFAPITDALSGGSNVKAVGADGSELEVAGSDASSAYTSRRKVNHLFNGLKSASHSDQSQAYSSSEEEEDGAEGVSSLLINAAEADPSSLPRIDPLPVDNFHLTRIPMIHPSPLFPHDSTAETLKLRSKEDIERNGGGGGGQYHICTFTNVCVTSDGIQLRFQNHTRYLEYSDLQKRCNEQKEYWSNKLCQCFHYSFKPLLLPYEFKRKYTEAAPSGEFSNDQHREYPNPFGYVKQNEHSHYWSIHKWVNHHHIAHWAQKLMIFQSVMQHEKVLFESENAQAQPPLPPLNGFIFHDTSNRYSQPLVSHEHLLNIFNFSLEAALEKRKRGTKEYLHPRIWSSSNTPHEMSQLLNKTNGRLIWSEDIDSGRYTTTLPMNSCEADDAVDVGRVEDETNADSTPKPPRVKKCSLSNPAYLQATAKFPVLPEGSSLLPQQGLRLSDGTIISEYLPIPTHHTCFARVSMTPTYGLLSMNPDDTRRFKQAVWKWLEGEMRREQEQKRLVDAAGVGGDAAEAAGGVVVTDDSNILNSKLTSIHTNPCPPRRAILLTRQDRRILNQQAIIDYLKQTYKLNLEIHEITGKNSSRQQIELFATTGLILSSHSSQLINVLFSHSSQSLIEITPEFYNVDFSSYSHALGVNFGYALGGKIPKSVKEDAKQLAAYTYVHDQLMVDCTNQLKQVCPTGNSWCFISESPRLCNKIFQWPNKQMNFYADMEAVKVAVHAALQHIQDKCFGKW